MRFRHFIKYITPLLAVVMFGAKDARSYDVQLDSVPAAPTQTIVQADTVKYWTKKWNLSLNGSQASYSNWSQGNNNSVAATGGNMFNATYKRARYSYDILLNLRYGQTKINGSEVRKTDDLIHFKNRVNHLLHATQYTAYFEVDFRTQFDAGYDKNRVYISDFMSPGYLQETAGLGYKPVDYIQLQSGFSMKQTFVADTLFSSRYGVTSGKNFRSEGGFSMGASFKKNVAKNLVLNSNVQTFTNFLQSVEYTDVMFNNELTGKINSFMNTNIQFALMYDRDFNKQIQVKQVLAVGLSFNVF
jgi:hypothetical protein